MDLEKEKFYLTEEGLENLKKEYEALKKIRINKTTDEAPNMLESQDLNPEYLSFREDLDLLETRIVDLENIIKNVAIIEKPSGETTQFVNLGAKVFVEVGQEKNEFIIVGKIEADPVLGKISNESPVGKALLGHKVGDEVKVSFPAKAIYKIKEIKYS
jgi:transcription elongation factor GreA